MELFLNEMGEDEGFFCNPPWAKTKIGAQNVYLDQWLNKIGSTLPKCPKINGGWVLIPLYDSSINHKNLHILECRQSVKKLFKLTQTALIINGFSYKIIDHDKGGYKPRSQNLCPFRTLALWITNKKAGPMVVEKIDLSNNKIKLTDLIKKTAPKTQSIRLFLSNQKLDSWITAVRFINQIYQCDDFNIDHFLSMKKSVITINGPTDDINKLSDLIKNSMNYQKAFY
jgi:hypothetical protein